MTTTERPLTEESPSTTPAASGLHQLAKTIGAVVAPTTLLTALAYYFGWLYTYYYCNYFGVNPSVLNYGTTDYLLYSVDSSFVPVTIGAFVLLLGLWGHAPLRGWLTAGFELRARRVFLMAITVVGLGLTVAGLWSEMWSSSPLNDHLAVAPLSLAAGVLLLTYAVHLWRAVAAARLTKFALTGPWPEGTEWAIALAIVSICLFWAVAAYAPAVGRKKAHELVTGLASHPPVVLYSAHSLSLTVTGVRETRCRAQDAAYHYRNDGLRFVGKAGAEYLLLPVNWSRAQGVAILIPHNDSVRLEFGAPGAQESPSPTC